MIVKFNIKFLFVSLCSVFIIGCSADSYHKVAMLDNDFNPTSKNLIMEHSSKNSSSSSKKSEYITDLRIALHKRGFTLLKADTLKVVTQSVKTDKKGKRSEKFSQYESPYMLTITAIKEGTRGKKRVYPCPFSVIQEIEMKIELSEIETNKVVAVIGAHGLTGICESRDLGVDGKTVFDEVAIAIDNIWSKIEKSGEIKIDLEDDNIESDEESSHFND